MSRGRDGPASFRGKYSGILQCDGYEGYDRVGAPGMVGAGYMAHARRKFHDVLKIDPQDREAAAVIAIMAKLYGVEREAREEGLAAEQRRELLQRKSRPIIEALKERFEEIARTSLPSSKLG